MTRDALADKALAVARSLADSPAIREGLKNRLRKAAFSRSPKR
ncbi:sensory histidine kinase DcuS [Salmonella enterica subsp. enterica serovar Heidelberg str. N189]|nr:sensory histidine kinase DcuS [Salmonella enterica subsp. enterica serovar Heidelberg str. N189]